MKQLQYFSFSNCEVLPHEVKQPQSAYKKFFPVITSICCLISIIVFVGINTGKPVDNVFDRWGWVSLLDIFSGNYYGIITNNFLHINFLHISFNLYWIWIFGKKIEYEGGSFFIALLILLSTFVSSMSQIAFAGACSVGLSGVGYSFFGYIFAKSFYSEGYKHFLNRRIINFFIFWLFFCFLINQTHLYNVGNSAHIGGVLFGSIIGYAEKYRKTIQVSVTATYVIILTSSVYWNPLSTSWRQYKAFELEKAGKTHEALHLYNEILIVDPNNEMAKKRVKQLEIFHLQEQAYYLHVHNNFIEARTVYNQILMIDSANSWARENINKLPVEIE